MGYNHGATKSQTQLSDPAHRQAVNTANFTKSALYGSSGCTLHASWAPSKGLLSSVANHHRVFNLVNELV